MKKITCIPDVRVENEISLISAWGKDEGQESGGRGRVDPGLQNDGAYWGSSLQRFSYSVSRSGKAAGVAACVRLCEIKKARACLGSSFQCSCSRGKLFLGQCWKSRYTQGRCINQTEERRRTRRQYQQENESTVKTRSFNLDFEGNWKADIAGERFTV